LKRLLEFFCFFCSISWGLGGFDDIWGENHFFKNFFSNGFNIVAVDAYSKMELCTPTWLNHDYGYGRVFEMSFSSQNVNFPFIWRDFWSFSFFSFFCSISWGLGGFDDIGGENHFFKNFFSNGFNIVAVDAYSKMELCTSIWLNHDYGDGRVVDILAMDTYSGVYVCMPIFMGEASN
jgi:hypothetical protein